MFWFIASIALLAAALITFLPLLRGKTFWQPAALALIFVLPAGGIWMYNEIGTPEAIDIAPSPRMANSSDAHAGEAGEMDAMVDSLRSKLTETPEDLDGWMLLARTLKTTQRYAEASEAVETAYRIAPDNPSVMVELAESWIFVSPDGQVPERSVILLEQALELDPNQQKALWLLGIAAAQQGDDAFAVSYWQSLLEQVEPGSTVAQSVQAQINEAQSRMGMKPEEVSAQVPDDGAWRGTQVSIGATDEALMAIPERAVLYVVIRPPGVAMGPPIGVRRLQNPSLPLTITISDQDSMLKERMISSETQIQLQARISLSGSPAPGSGDWQSSPVTIALDSGETVELILDQQVE
jgi:cytochrome c-type biogenesis protein CcmH